MREQLGATIFPQILSFLVNSYLELARCFRRSHHHRRHNNPLRVRYYRYYTMIFGASARLWACLCQRSDVKAD